MTSTTSTTTDTRTASMLDDAPEASNALLVHAFTEWDEPEVLDFLARRPEHTVFMAGLIRDNGLVSQLNRGTFYGCRNARLELEGVLLLGHIALTETRNDEALDALARFARLHPAPRVLFGESDRVAKFWKSYGQTGREPRLIHRELLLGQRLPVADFERVPALRLATLNDLALVMNTHAQMTFDENGVNPLETDPIGFRLRTARRIDQERVWVWIEDDRLIFKADIISDTPDVTYIEGVYTNPAERGKGYGTRCMLQMGLNLLARSVSVSLLVNESNDAALRLYTKAGYSVRSHYDTMFF